MVFVPHVQSLAAHRLNCRSRFALNPEFTTFGSSHFTFFARGRRKVRSAVAKGSQCALWQHQRENPPLKENQP